ncbi:hypothetical protein Zmor_002247 [Zophobas morio]|uniref:Transmembrane protein n=1 Tax=Zophobas morio TaxID=2755281 RepID=A0AA38MTL2_9CUCU|nr:hypothetical protein Zmor_002247 [Zophobas morio]
MTPTTLPEVEEVLWLFLFLEVRSVHFDPPTSVSNFLDHLLVCVTVFGIAAPERKTVSPSPFFFCRRRHKSEPSCDFQLQGRRPQVQEEPVLKEVVAQEKRPSNSVLFVKPFCIYLSLAVFFIIITVCGSE